MKTFTDLAANSAKVRLMLQKMHCYTQPQAAVIFNDYFEDDGVYTGTPRELAQAIHHYHIGL